jgi:hypothetical protein
MASFEFSDPVIVLGFCRSGTTLVAEMIHRGGIPMVTPDEEEAAARYDDGEKYERALCQRINTEIFGLQRRPRTISALWKHEQQPLTETQLQRLHDEVGNAPWGFKDPQTTMTYRHWCDAFPRGPRFYTYRGHEEVLRHYFRIAKNRYRALELTGRALRAWVHYNERTQENLRLDREAQRPAVLIRYEELMEQNDLMARMQEITQVPLFDARNPELRRSKSTVKRGAFESFCYRFATLNFRARVERCYEQLEQARLAPGA